MKNIFSKFISNLIEKKQNNKESKEKAKLLHVYLDSVGKCSYSLYKGEYAVRNREIHKPIWNKYVKHKSDYEIFKKVN
jgi:hypothetical protein